MLFWPTLYQGTNETWPSSLSEVAPLQARFPRKADYLKRKRERERRNRPRPSHVAKAERGNQTVFWEKQSCTLSWFHGWSKITWRLPKRICTAYYQGIPSERISYKTWQTISTLIFYRSVCRLKMRRLLFAAEPYMPFTFPSGHFQRVPGRGWTCALIFLVWNGKNSVVWQKCYGAKGGRSAKFMWYQTPSAIKEHALLRVCESYKAIFSRFFPPFVHVCASLALSPSISPLSLCRSFVLRTARWLVLFWSLSVCART